MVEKCSDLEIHLAIAPTKWKGNVKMALGEKEIIGISNANGLGRVEGRKALTQRGLLQGREGI